MQTVKLNIEFPEEIFFTLRKLDRDVDKCIKRILALELFRGGKISFGKAAELADMCIADFMDLTRREKIPMRDYTNGEVKGMFNNVEKLAKEIKSGGEEGSG